MAKRTFAKLLASLEDQDGTAKVVDALNPEASLDNEVEDTAPAITKVDGEVQTTDAINEEMKDYTAIDDAAKKQGEALHKQMERLTEAESSLEAYVGILRSAVKNGRGIDCGTAAVMVQDLAAQYPKFFKPMLKPLESISMEDADSDTSDSRAVAITKQAEKEGTGRLGKLKGAVVEGWKKFWEWVKSIYTKVKALIKKVFGIVEVETKKTTYLLTVAAAIPEKGKAPKSLPKPPAGVTSKAADKVQLLIGHEKKVIPPKELPESIRISGSSILESVENDLWGMGSRETGGLTHIYDYYTNMMWRAANHLKKEVITVADADAFEKDIKALAKFPTTAIFAGNKKFAYKEGTASLKLVDSEAGGKSYEEVKMLSKADIKMYLEKNATLLGNIKWIGESWEKTLTMLSELDTKVKAAENAEIKSIVTKRITEFLNSDVDAFFKLCTDVAAKRNQLLDHMLMIHADCAGSGNE